MKKVRETILIGMYIFLLMMLAIFASWELYGKDFVERYIDTNYGNAIIETNNNSKLSLKLLKNDT